MQFDIVLYPKDRDLSRRWFLKYPSPHGGTPQKKYVPDLPTVEAREAAAAEIIASIEQELKPFTLINGNVPKWLTDAVEARYQGKRQKTVEAYKSKLGRFLQWYREKRIERLTEMSGAEYLRWLSKKYKINNAATLNRYRVQTSSFFKDLIEAGLTTTNPFKTTKALPEGSSTKTWFRIEVQAKLQEIIEQRDYQLWLACMTQFYCFIRPGEELQSLRIEDIMDGDTESRKFRIECTHAKTGIFRYVPIPPPLWDLLKPYITGYPSHYYIFGKHRTPSQHKIGRGSLYERHKYYIKYLDLPAGYSFYSWKNTGAVMMYKNGVKMKYISLLMGHYDFSVTDRYFKSLGIDDVMDEVKINYPMVGQRPIKPPAGQ